MSFLWPGLQEQGSHLFSCYPLSGFADYLFPPILNQASLLCGVWQKCCCWFAPQLGWEMLRRHLMAPLEEAELRGVNPEVFQVTGKPDCLEGNNQKSTRMSAWHLVIIISFFFSCCTTALTPHLCMTGLCMKGMGTENLNPSLISAPHLPFGLKQDIHNLIYPLLKVSWGLIRPRFINNTFYMQHCTAYSQHNAGPGGKWQCSPSDRSKVSWGLLQWGLLRWLTIMTSSK